MIYLEQDSLKKRVKIKVDKIIGTKNRVKIENIMSNLKYRKEKKAIIESIDNEANNESADIGIEVCDYNIWKKAYKGLIKTTEYKNFLFVYKTFLSSKIEFVKSGDIASKALNSKAPIVIMAEKNENKKLPAVLDYYRKELGVSCFAIIDNESTDGSYEYLMNQDDVILFKTTETYNGRKRMVWICRVIAMLGLERWYLFVDADECYTYPSMEQYNLKEYTTLLKERRIFSVKSLLLEVYPQKSIYEIDSNYFINEYNWFDPDGDDYEYDPYTNTIYGGMHKRVFNKERTMRTKTSLFYVDGNRFPISSHSIYPNYDDISSKIGGITLHYKFLPEDISKLDEIISEGSFFGENEYYKAYRNTIVNGGMDMLWNSNSKEWKGAESFKYFPFVYNMVGDK